MDQVIEETGLAVILKENELSEAESSDILEKFSEIEAIAADWKKKAQALEVTREDQVAEMKMAREGRLFLQKKRTAVESTRKDMKAEYLKKGRAIDEVAKYLKGLIEPIEEDLERKEKFAELLAAERQRKKQEERMARLEPYNLAVEPGMIGSMTDQMFESYIKGVDADAKVEAERARKEEEERLEQERISETHRQRRDKIMDLWNFFPEEYRHENFGRITEGKWNELVSTARAAKSEYDAEQERIRQENERLRKEAEEKEAQLAKERAAAEEKSRKEREAQEAILRKEREERERVQAELQAKRDAEEAQRRADEAKAKQEAEALKKAEKAPDKEKLSNWINSLVLPDVTVKGAEAQATTADIRTKFELFKAWAQKQVEAL